MFILTKRRKCGGKLAAVNRARQLRSATVPAGAKPESGYAGAVARLPGPPALPGSVGKKPPRRPTAGRKAQT